MDEINIYVIEIIKDGYEGEKNKRRGVELC
jgi:hypothetical protein